MTNERRSYLLRCTLAVAFVGIGLLLYDSSRFFNGAAGTIVNRVERREETTLFLSAGRRIVRERVASEIARSCLKTYERNAFSFSYACDGRQPTFTSAPIRDLFGATLFVALGVYQFVKRHKRWWLWPRLRKYPYDLLEK